MANQYWLGTVQARLQENHVDATWDAGTNFEKSPVAAKVNILNKAFEIYYDARTSIQKCPDQGVRQQMQSDLEDAATTGWGLGVSDLEEAFQHLCQNGGRWKDNNTARYYFRPDKPKCFSVYVEDAPAAATNFLFAVEDRLAIVQEAAADLKSKKESLDRGSERELKQWDQIGKALDGIVKWGKRVEPHLWGAPSVQDKVGRIVGMAEVISDIHGSIGKIQERAAHVVLLTDVGFKPKEAAALEALTVVLDRVPVLGKFYANAMELFVTLPAWMQDLMQDYYIRLHGGARVR
jgi:hypothetical protein